MCGLPIRLFILFAVCESVERYYPYPAFLLDDANIIKIIPNDWNVNDASIMAYILVRNVNVEKIKSFAFKDFISLNVLELRGRVTAIEDHAFSGLDKLERLTLNGVGIQVIGPKVFHNLNRLKWLDIARNEIREVQVTNLTVLIELYLSHNNISELMNNTFVNLENLKSIDLSENKIRTVKYGSFAGCQSLASLNLNKNQIAKFESLAFVHLYKLEVLSLRHNNLTTISMEHLPKLKRLDVSNNLINEINVLPFLGFGLSALASLDLSHNRISSLHPKLLFRMRELTDFRLDHNSITSLPERFFRSTPKLEYLDLRFNLIKELYLLDNLEKLNRVLLQHNKLESIELSATTQMNLEVLDISDNNLPHLNESLQHLNNLRELSLNKNKIKSFPLCIPGTLTNLDLSQNILYGIALDKFCGSVSQGKLRIVDLSSNQFTSYNLTYTNKSLQETQPDLNEIDLSKNFFNADSVKQIQNYELRHIEFLKIDPQRKDDKKQSTPWIFVTSAALVAVFAGSPRLEQENTQSEQNHYEEID